jgi:hypothetical protein
MKMINRGIKHNVREWLSVSAVFIFSCGQISKEMFQLFENAQFCLLNIAIMKLYMVELEGAICY